MLNCSALTLVVVFGLAGPGVDEQLVGGHVGPSAKPAAVENGKGSAGIHRFESFTIAYGIIGEQQFS